MTPNPDARICHEVQLPGGRRVHVTYLDSGNRWPATPSRARAQRTSAPAQRTSAPAQRTSAPAQRTSAPTPARPPLPAPATAAGAAHQEELHVCPRCKGRLVHPMDWSEQAPERWRIAMRCPDCGHTHEGVFGRSSVERLDDELDRACGALLRDLRTLTQANMSAEIDRFAKALALDLIGPDDF